MKNRKLTQEITCENGFIYVRILTGEIWALYEKRQGNRFLGYIINHKTDVIPAGYLEKTGRRVNRVLKYAIMDFAESNSAVQVPKLKVEVKIIRTAL